MNWLGPRVEGVRRSPVKAWFRPGSRLPLLTVTEMGSGILATSTPPLPSDVRTNLVHISPRIEVQHIR